MCSLVISGRSEKSEDLQINIFLMKEKILRVVKNRNTSEATLRCQYSVHISAPCMASCVLPIYCVGVPHILPNTDTEYAYVFHHKLYKYPGLGEVVLLMEVCRPCCKLCARTKPWNISGNLGIFHKINS